MAKQIRICRLLACEKCGSMPIIPGGMPTAIGIPPLIPAIGSPINACASC